jgi:KRAB domain-containing zinc finger protein
MKSSQLHDHEGKQTEYFIKHNQTRYDCDECAYTTNDNWTLTQHRQSKHEGVIYSCDKCDYKATVKNTLQRHKKLKHGGMISINSYHCDQCDCDASDVFLRQM